MEKSEKELLLKLINVNPRLKTLYKKHQQLEKQVTKYERYASCSSFALRRQNEIKKEKLNTKDKIQEILRYYKKEEFLEAVNS